VKGKAIYLEAFDHICTDVAQVESNITSFQTAKGLCGSV